MGIKKTLSDNVKKLLKETAWGVLMVISAVLSIIGLILAMVSAILYAKNITVFGVLFDIGVVMVICNVISIITVAIVKLSDIIKPMHIVLQTVIAIVCFVIFEVLFRKVTLTPGIITFGITEIIIVLLEGTYMFVCRAISIKQSENIE